MMVFYSASRRRFLAELATTWVPTRVQNPHYGHNIDISCAWQGVFLGLHVPCNRSFTKGLALRAQDQCPVEELPELPPPAKPGLEISGHG